MLPVTYRQGKSLSKIGAQYWGLEQQGDDVLSVKIGSFIWREYNKIYDATMVMDDMIDLYLMSLI